MFLPRVADKVAFALLSPGILALSRLGDVALSQKRVHGDNTAFQDQVLSDGLDGRDLIGFVVHGVLGQGDAHMVRQRR